MNKEIVYIAELDADVDDVVAAHYLHNKDVLKCVVLDPYPKTKEGLERKERLESLGVTVLKKMPPVAKYAYLFWICYAPVVEVISVGAVLTDQLEVFIRNI